MVTAIAVATLRAAPILGVLDEMSCQTAAAMFRKDIEIADFAEAAPFDVEHGGHGDDRLRGAVPKCKRTPAGGIGEHSPEIFLNPRRRRGEALLTEEPSQQLDRGRAGFMGDRLNFRRRSRPAAMIIGISRHG